MLVAEKHPTLPAAASAHGPKFLGHRLDITRATICPCFPPASHWNFRGVSVAFEVFLPIKRLHFAPELLSQDKKEKRILRSYARIAIVVLRIRRCVESFPRQVLTAQLRTENSFILFERQ